MPQPQQQVGYHHQQQQQQQQQQQVNSYTQPGVQNMQRLGGMGPHMGGMGSSFDGRNQHPSAPPGYPDMRQSAPALANPSSFGKSRAVLEALCTCMC